MNFDINRLGLPNTAALVALAIMPVMALTTLADPRPAVALIEQAEAAAICPPPVACTQIAIAAVEPEFFAE